MDPVLDLLQGLDSGRGPLGGKLVPYVLQKRNGEPGAGGSAVGVTSAPSPGPTPGATIQGPRLPTDPPPGLTPAQEAATQAMLENGNALAELSAAGYLQTLVGGNFDELVGPTAISLIGTVLPSGGNPANWSNGMLDTVVATSLGDSSGLETNRQL